MRERYLGPGLSPLQEEYSRQVDDLIRRAATSRRGRVVFFAGGAGSGRSFLLEGIARLPRERPKPIVIAGRFEHGRYIPGGQPQGNAIPAEVKDLITATLKAGSDLLGPVGPLIEQLVGASVAAYEWLRRERGRHEVSELLPRLLRAAAAAEPLVCLVDDMDHAEGAWWVSLLLSFAQEVNEELPLVLCFAVDAPADIEHPQDDESNACYAGRRLVERGLAEWCPLRLLNRSEISAWLGPMRQELLTALCEITDSTPGELVELWDAWQQRGVIEQVDAELWRPTGVREGILVDAAEILNERLRALLRSDAPRELDQARELLACAALEGRTFTAEAVARALGWEPDHLNDFIHNGLLTEEDDSHGLLRGSEGVTIHAARGAPRHLRRYAFARQLDCRIARERFLTDDERRQLARGLASALAERYSPEVDRVAPVLAALYTRAGDPHEALHYRRVANFGASRAVLRTEAQQLLRDRTDDWDRYDLQRAAALLLEAGNALLTTDPYPDTLAIAERAEQLATRAEARLAGAQAVYLQAQVRTELGEYEQATRLLLKAQQMLARGVPGRLQVQIFIQFASIDASRGDFHRARERCDQALRLARANRDRDGEANTCYHLGTIAVHVGDYDAAPPWLERALSIMRQIGERAGEGATRHMMGVLALKRRDYKAAQPHFEHALAIRREIGDRAGEAATCHQLAWQAALLGDHDGALSWVKRALGISQGLGDRAGEASAWHLMGGVALKVGDYARARRQMQQALSIRREIGARAGEASTRHQLGRLAHTVGDYKAARRWLLQALTIRREIGDRADEAATRQALGELPPGT